MKVSLVIAMVTTVTLVANAQLLVYYVAGPLIANFTYDKYLLPNGTAKTNCSEAWFQLAVHNFSGTAVDTVHVTADFLFSGWNDTRVLQQISFEYVSKHKLTSFNGGYVQPINPVLDLCYASGSPAWTLYFGTGKQFTNK